MLRFRRMRTLQKFASVHASVHNHFNQERSLSNRHSLKLNRAAALAEWRDLFAAQHIARSQKLRRVRIGLIPPVAGLDAARTQQVLKVPQRKWNADTEHHRLTSDLGVGSEHLRTLSRFAIRFRDAPLATTLAAINCRWSIQRHRLGPNSRHCLTLGPFAAQRRQTTVHQGHVVQQQIAHAQECFCQRASSVGGFQ
jgi:hypothetical protein